MLFTCDILTGCGILRHHSEANCNCRSLILMIRNVRANIAVYALCMCGVCACDLLCVDAHDPLGLVNARLLQVLSTCVLLHVCIPCIRYTIYYNLCLVCLQMW